ncbi:protein MITOFERRINLIKE 1, chloroplastic [Amborella trichopoda]|nr:protein MITOFERRINLIKE 1, chloroplastic [Amborella trichopoda]|eukprot:XP_006854607.2 protein MITOFERRINLIKE 1, chloroplastic [Amborella trichopoda]
MESSQLMEHNLLGFMGLLPSPEPCHHPQTSFIGFLDDFKTRFCLSSPNPYPKSSQPKIPLSSTPNFCSSSLSVGTHIKNTPCEQNPSLKSMFRPVTRDNQAIKAMLKNISVFEKAFIGAMAGGFAGAFTYVCLLPLDTVKTKLQTRGASELYTGAIDVISKVLKNEGILGLYSGVSAVIVGSAISSAIYFGTCELGKSLLAKVPSVPPIMIPPTAGAMGNLVSSAIMVPKELITQRMQAGAKGRSWEVLLRILERDGILGLYAGYSATLLRNLPAGVLSYSSFEYLKSAVLSRTGNSHLEPFQSVCCGALAGAISASLTTPLDVVKTRLMTQIQSGAIVDPETKAKITILVYTGISSTMREILKEEGWMGLTRGMGPRVLHSACFAALGYFAFETAKLTFLHHHVSRKEKALHHD